MVRVLSAALLIALGIEAARAGTVTVKNTTDADAGSLRDAIANAADGDTIIFSVPSGSTITLTSGALVIAKNVSITGYGADFLTLARSSTAGTPEAPVFNINAGNFAVTISALTITNGKA